MKGASVTRLKDPRLVLSCLALAGALLAGCVPTISTSGAQPKRARVTAEPPPSSTSTTSTPTAPPPPAPTTTTTTTPTPTTTVAPSCGGPITITVGGTYSGCYRSTNPDVPAVTIRTTQHVVLDHARIEHAGFGVFAYWDYQADLDIHDSTFQQLNPGAGRGSARAVYAYNTLRLVFEHNLLRDGAGVRWAGPDIDATLGRIRYNRAYNIGRYSPPEEGLVQFFQAAESPSQRLELAWNEVHNTPGLTHVEDVINFYKANGTPSALFDVHHNLLDGSFRPPTTGPYPHTGPDLSSATRAARTSVPTTTGSSPRSTPGRRSPPVTTWRSTTTS